MPNIIMPREKYDPFYRKLKEMKKKNEITLNQVGIKLRGGRASVTGGSFSILQNVACRETRKNGYVVPYS